jgi:hypothetical protein
MGGFEEHGTTISMPFSGKDLRNPSPFTDLYSIGEMFLDITLPQHIQLAD